MASDVKLSSKGQVVLPKAVRKKLGLKKGDMLKVEVDPRRKRIVIQPSVAPPKEIFVHAGSKLSDSILQESRKLDEKKADELLKALGVC